MKFNIKKAFNVALSVIVLFLFVNFAKNYYFSWTQKGEIVSIFNLTSIDDYQLQIKNKKHLLIFWATWCPPCAVELNRINNMVINGDLNRENIIAISIGEEEDLVAEFARKNDYRFIVVADTNKRLANEFSVRATPTLVLLDEENKIQWHTTGISPSLEMRLKRFF